MGYVLTVFCSNAVHGKGEYYFDRKNLWHEAAAEEIHTAFVFVRSRKYISNGKDRVLGMVDFYVNMLKTARQYERLHGKPDVIIGSSVHPLAILAGERLAKRYKVKCVAEVRDLWPESIFAYYPEMTGKLYSGLLYSGEKYLYKKADAVIMTWPGGKDYVRKKGWLTDMKEEKFHHLSNGVDLDEFDRQRKENTYSDSDLDDDSTFKFVYTGSVRKVNNIGMVVEAARILSEKRNEFIKILVFGDGDELEKLKCKCSEKKLDNIIFKGKVDKQSVPSVLSQCDCTLMHNTSTVLNQYGQSQNKFFEYLAAGKPVLMTYPVGYSICREEGCGIEVEVQNAENIAAAMEKMSSMSRSDRDSMGKNARVTAQKYDYGHLSEKLADIIES
ncbi:MAG: glycosyltransferase family 4 protein [Ruminococcus flavefaciens]|nr:glycosyltransferase family 4 protein [Ruminococcus flavefaciens]